jgi:glycosyltransferase involved in cell wall biosynthesis
MNRPRSFAVNPLRVLYLDYSVGFGGAVKSLSLTLSGLPSVDKFIVTSQDQSQVALWFPGLPVRSFRRILNYRTYRGISERVKRPLVRAVTLKLLAALDMLVALKNTGWLVSLVKRHRIDIIHLNNGFVPPEALAAVRIARVPCVIHLRDFHRDIQPLKPGLIASVSRVIAVSDAVAKSLDGTVISPSMRTTIHDPVDLERIACAAQARERVRAECELPANAIAVGIFGRVVRWKGQLEFVRAMCEAMPTDARLWAIIVGDESDGGDTYIREVRASIKSSGAAERFILTGYRQNVEDYYGAMDIVVHASISPEPFGMVVPEAMAAGCAVVAADDGGPREVIDPGIDGLLVPPGDVLGLARAVLALAGDASLRTKLGAAARRKAISRFGIPASAERVAAVYQTLMSSNTIVGASVSQSTVAS